MTTPPFPVDAPVSTEALAQGWVARAPAWLLPYLQLARLDRPIGTWLLFWPCLCGVALAGPTLAQAAWLAVLFGLGSLAMRGAGCAYNDIVDRHIDAQVSRTAQRPLPSGRLSLRAAWACVGLLCLAGLGVLVQLNRLAAMIALASVLLVAAYPFMKRITWWPQAWLGLTFNWGVLVGFASVDQMLTWPAVLLYAAGLFWTLGYDSIYAFQDLEDDALVGVKSSARALGPARARLGVGLFYAASVLLLMAALVMASGRWWAAAAALPIAAHLALQVRHLQPENPARCLALFRANRDAGALMALACFAVWMV